MVVKYFIFIKIRSVFKLLAAMTLNFIIDFQTKNENSSVSE